jgi:hypothetical protein
VVKHSETPWSLRQRKRRPQREKLNALTHLSLLSSRSNRARSEPWFSWGTTVIRIYLGGITADSGWARGGRQSNHDVIPVAATIAGGRDAAEFKASLELDFKESDFTGSLAEGSWGLP